MDKCVEHKGVRNVMMTEGRDPEGKSQHQTSDHKLHGKIDEEISKDYPCRNKVKI